MWIKGYFGWKYMGPHKDLDATYGWEYSLEGEDILRWLLALNLERAKG